MPFDRPAFPAPERLRRFLEARVNEGRMSGATWWVGRPGGAVSRGAVGTVAAGSAPAAEETPYDLASLTKPLATATLLVLLEQAGSVDLEAPLASCLPGTRGSAFARQTLLSLATHTAGLPAWAPLYLQATDLEGYIAEIVGRPPVVPPGRTLYSDLGYILLGAAIEGVARRRLDELFLERIAGPLGLVRAGFASGARRFEDAAATERGSGYERALAGEAGAAHPWRAEIPRGEVHDANAHGLGGVAGHAGLFGTAAEVARIGCEMLRPGALRLGERARQRLLRVVPPSDGRTVGLVVAAQSRAGRGVLPDEAPGHSGFTGTSLWLDVAAESCYVLLANRVHPRVSGRDFQWLRRAFHRLAAAELRGRA